MALRHWAEYDDLQGATWRLEIHDPTWVQPAIEFCFGKKTITLSPDGKTDVFYTPIRPVRAEFDMLANGAELDAFVLSMANAEEGKFTVKIEKDSVLQFTGFILTDNITLEDRQRSTYISINVSGGLVRLKGFDYKQPNGEPYTGVDSLHEIIFNCFEKISELKDFYSATDVFYSSVINWYEAAMNLTTLPDTLKATKVDQEIFFERIKGGEYKYLSCFEVLTHICNRFNATITQTGGRFEIHQHEEIVKPLFRRIDYDKSGVLLADGNQNYQKTIDQTTIKRLQPAGFGFLPGLKSVTETYDYFNYRNLMQGREFLVFPPTQLSPAFYDLGSFSTATAGGFLRMKAAVKVRIFRNSPASQNWKDVSAKFKFRIQYGTKYLKRTKFQTAPGDNSYTPQVWTTTQSEFEFFSPLQPASLENAGFNFVLEFDSPDINENGELSIQILTASPLDKNFNAVTGLSIYYAITPELYLISSDESARPSSSQTFVSPNASDKYTVKLETENIIGDGPTGTIKNRIRIINSVGGTTDSGGNWRIGTTGTTYKISDLSVRTHLGFQDAAIQKMTGGVMLPKSSAASVEPTTALLYRSKIFVLLNGTYDTRMCEWDGVWVEAAKSTVNTTTNITAEIGRVNSPSGVVGIAQSGIQNAISVINQVATPNTLDGGLTSGSSLTSLTINASTYGEIIQGDILNLFDPTTNNFQSFVAAADVAPGATVVTIEAATLNSDFTDGSFLTVNSSARQAQALCQHIPISVFERTENVVTGTTPRFWGTPESLDSKKIKSIHFFVATAPQNDLEITIYKNGNAFVNPATITGGQQRTKFDLTDVFGDAGTWTFSIAYPTGGTEAQGLIVVFEISGITSTISGWVLPGGGTWTTPGGGAWL